MPWNLNIEADCDALFYLHGNLIGRYSVTARQVAIYLPGPAVRTDDRQTSLMVVLV